MGQNKIPWHYIVSVVHINGLPVTFPLIMPYQTAECERGFSWQNSTKTSCRNKLKEKHLNVFLTIKTSTFSVADWLWISYKYVEGEESL